MNNLSNFDLTLLIGIGFVVFSFLCIEVTPISKGKKERIYMAFVAAACIFGLSVFLWGFSLVDGMRMVG